MEYIALSVLIVIVGIYLLLPFAYMKESYYLSKDQNLQRLLTERDELYRAIADLDFEYSCGKLCEDDYRNLRETYKRKAIDVVKVLEDVTQGGEDSKDLKPVPDFNQGDVKERLEQEMLKVRKELT